MPRKLENAVVYGGIMLREGVYGQSRAGAPKSGNSLERERHYRLSLRAPASVRSIGPNPSRVVKGAIDNTKTPGEPHRAGSEKKAKK